MTHKSAASIFFLSDRTAILTASLHASTISEWLKLDDFSKTVFQSNRTDLNVPSLLEIRWDSYLSSRYEPYDIRRVFTCQSIRSCKYAPLALG